MSKPVVFQVKFSDISDPEYNNDFIEWTLYIPADRSAEITYCPQTNKRNHISDFATDSNLWECEARIIISSIDIGGKVRRLRSQMVNFNCDKKSVNFKLVDSRKINVAEIEIQLQRTTGIRPECSFDAEQSEFSDVTFLVESKKVYAHRSILSVNSHYFNSMFLSNFAEKKMEEIELEGVDYYEFTGLLDAVYSGSDRVTKENVSYLLKLADMYGFDRLMRQCETFLETDENIHEIDVINYAEQYRFNKILKRYHYLIGNLGSYGSLMTSNQGQKREQSDPLNKKWQLMILDDKRKEKYMLEMEKREKTAKTEIVNNINDWKDTALKVGNVDILVNREYLSIYSAYFQRIFYGNLNDSAIVLDVNCEQFLDLLEHIYHPEYRITNDNVLHLLKLSTEFGIEFIINNCEQFLIADEQIPPIDKMILSENHRLCKLQQHCVKKYHSALSPVFDLLGELSQLALLRSSSYNPFKCSRP